MTSIGRSATFFPTAPGAAVATGRRRARARTSVRHATSTATSIVEGKLPGGAAPSGGSAPDHRGRGRLGDGAAPRHRDRRPVRPAPLLAAKTSSRCTRHRRRHRRRRRTRLRRSGSGRTTSSASRRPSWDTIPFLISQEDLLQRRRRLPADMISDFTTLIYVDTGAINARNADSVTASLTSYKNELDVNVQRTTWRRSCPTSSPPSTRSCSSRASRCSSSCCRSPPSSSTTSSWSRPCWSSARRARSRCSRAAAPPRRRSCRSTSSRGWRSSLIALAVGPAARRDRRSASSARRRPSPTSAAAPTSASISRPAAYLWAGGGALLAFVTLLCAGLPGDAAHRRAAAHGQRPAAEAAGLHALLPRPRARRRWAASCFYQLDRRGSLVTEGFFGEQSVDPVMLLTPAFFILTVGIVFLRLFPLVLRLLAWVVARAQGAAILIGMWQLVRNPVHYSRLVLLLMLATAVGMFAASFGATLDRSYADRACLRVRRRLRASTSMRTHRRRRARRHRRRRGAASSAPTRASAVYRISGSQGRSSRPHHRRHPRRRPGHASATSPTSATTSPATRCGSLLAKLRGRAAGAAAASSCRRTRAGSASGSTRYRPARRASASSSRCATPPGRYFSYLLGPDDVQRDAAGLEPAGRRPERPGINFTDTSSGATPPSTGQRPVPRARPHGAAHRDVDLAALADPRRRAVRRHPDRRPARPAPALARRHLDHSKLLYDPHARQRRPARAPRRSSSFDTTRRLGAAAGRAAAATLNDEVRASRLRAATRRWSCPGSPAHGPDQRATACSPPAAQAPLPVLASEAFLDDQRPQGRRRRPTSSSPTSSSTSQIVDTLRPLPDPRRPAHQARRSIVDGATLGRR